MIGIGLGTFASQSSSPVFEFGNVFKPSVSGYAESDTSLTDLNNATNASIHYWVKVESGNIAVLGDNQLTTNRFAINPWSDNKVYFNCSNGTVSTATADFTPYYGVWTLVSLVFNGGGATNSDRLKAYVNNATPLSLTFTGTIPSTLSATCGNSFQLNRGGAFAFIGVAQYSFPVITSDSSTPAQISDYYNSGLGAWAKDSFTNIVLNADTNQADGATTMDGLEGSAGLDIVNCSTPPAYFVAKT